MHKYLPWKDCSIAYVPPAGSTKAARHEAKGQIMLCSFSYLGSRKSINRRPLSCRAWPFRSSCSTTSTTNQFRPRNLHQATYNSTRQCRCEHLLRQFAQHSGLVRLWQLFEHFVYTLRVFVPHGAQSIPCYCARHRTWKVCHNESHRPATQSANHTPKLPGGSRMSTLIIRHPLFPEHLFKRGSKLLVCETVLALFLGILAASKAESRPRKAEACTTTFCRSASMGVLICGGVRAAEAGVLARGIIVLAPSWVG